MSTRAPRSRWRRRSRARQPSCTQPELLGGRHRPAHPRPAARPPAPSDREPPSTTGHSTSTAATATEHPGGLERVARRRPGRAAWSRRICVRTNGIEATARAARISQTPIARRAAPPPASTMAADVGSDPDGTAQLGHEAAAPAAHVEPQLDARTAAAATSDGDEPAPAGAGDGQTHRARRARRARRRRSRAARRVRGSERWRRRSTMASFSGVRTRKASSAATPMARPGHDQPTSSPSSTGSKVRPQPPCSLGRATARQRRTLAATEPAGAARAAQLG